MATITKLIFADAGVIRVKRMSPEELGARLYDG